MKMVRRASSHCTCTYPVPPLSSLGAIPALSLFPDPSNRARARAVAADAVAGQLQRRRRLLHLSIRLIRRWMSSDPLRASPAAVATGLSSGLGVQVTAPAGVQG